MSFLASPYDFLQTKRDPGETLSNNVIFAGNSSVNLFLPQALQLAALGWVDNILSTASNYRVHLARNPEYSDRNYGGILIIWDRLFGTNAPDTTKPDFGIVEPIGTKNPLLVNIRPITRLYTKAKRQTTLSRKLRVVFGPPGLHL